MAFVLDASIALAWAFADEDDPRATAALARIRTDELNAPNRDRHYRPLTYA
jgi:hypothetical protein